MDKHKESLLAKPIDQLRELAAAFDPPIQLERLWTKKVIVARIMDREHQEANKVSPPHAAGVDGTGPPQPDFEAAAAQPGPERVERRGGPRPGAGRPLGMTDEKAKARNLTPIPNVTIHKAIFLGGQAWANAVQIPQVAFSEEETTLLSLPLTHIHDTYFPNLIPEMGHVFVALAYGIHQLVIVRLALIKEIQAQRKAGKNVETIAECEKKATPPSGEGSRTDPSQPA